MQHNLPEVDLRQGFLKVIYPGVVNPGHFLLEINSGFDFSKTVGTPGRSG